MPKNMRHFQKRADEPSRCPESLSKIPVYREREETPEEQRFRLKKEKRVRKEKARKARQKARYAERKVTNYSIVRYRPEGYVPLRGLGTFSQISMTVRYLFDKKYREEQTRRREVERAEKTLMLKVSLRRFITKTLNNVPARASALVQIDNMFSPVLQDVLQNTMELKFYDIEIIKMNPNYLYYVKKPHPLIRFIPLPEYESTGREVPQYGT